MLSRSVLTTGNPKLKYSSSFRGRNEDCAVADIVRHESDITILQKGEKFSSQAKAQYVGFISSAFVLATEEMKKHLEVHSKLFLKAFDLSMGSWTGVYYSRLRDTS